MLIRSIIVVIGLMSAPALASDQTDGPAPAAAPPKAAKICRREVPTGSIMARSTCRTRAEWGEIDAMYARNADLVRDARDGQTGSDQR